MTQNQLSKVADVTADLPALRITREDITKHFCKMATEQEVALALAIVKSLNLNPFMREVHFIKYSQNDKMAIVVGYEVYIKRAERSGRLNGWTAGIDKENNTSWVKIHRKDWTEPFFWEVSLAEFDKKQSTWKQIPSFMAKKVAIAQGFRLCFSEELSGMPYTEEEHQVYDVESKEVNAKPEVQMPKALEAPKAENAPEQPKTAETQSTTAEELKTQPQARQTPLPTLPEPSAKLEALETLSIQAFKAKGKKRKDWVNYLGSYYGVEDIRELTDAQIASCTIYLNSLIAESK